MNKFFAAIGYVLFSALMLFFEDKITRFTVEEILEERGLIAK